MKKLACVLGIILFSSVASANTYIRADNSDLYDLGDFYSIDKNTYQQNNYDNKSWYPDHYQKQLEESTAHWGSKVN